MIPIMTKAKAHNVLYKIPCKLTREYKSYAMREELRLCQEDSLSSTIA